MAIGQIELAFRVAAGLFVIVAPTLLFLGLWKGLMRLRDDDLVERMRRMEGRASPSPPTSGVVASAVSALGENGRPTVVCDSCGTQNRAGMDYCGECLAALADE